jgi:toxin CcdB
MDDHSHLLDVQTDFLAYLETRIVIPLLIMSDAPPPAKGLNPIFWIGSTEMILATHLMSAVHRRMLRTKVANLSEDRDKIVAAIDFLMQGF